MVSVEFAKQTLKQQFDFELLSIIEQMCEIGKGVSTKRLGVEVVDRIIVFGDLDIPGGEKNCLIVWAVLEGKGLFAYPDMF